MSPMSHYYWYMRFLTFTCTNEIVTSIGVPAPRVPKVGGAKHFRVSASGWLHIESFASNMTKEARPGQAELQTERLSGVQSALQIALKSIKAHDKGPAHCGDASAFALMPFMYGVSLGACFFAPIALCFVAIGSCKNEVIQDVPKHHSGGVTHGSSEKDVGESERRKPTGPVPIGFLRLLCVTYFFLNVNFTVMMPNSHLLAWKSHRSTTYSGFAIGAYGFGFMASFPVFGYMWEISIWGCWMLYSTFMVSGNLIIAVWPTSKWSLMIGRFVTGCEAGIDIVLINMITFFSADDFRVSDWSFASVFCALGLMLGPVVSSVTTGLLSAVLRESQEVAPCMFMVIVGCVIGGISGWWIPSRDACFEMACGGPEARSSSDNNVVDPSGNERHPEPEGESAFNGCQHEIYNQVRIMKGWIAAILDWSQTIIRLCLRVGWEASMVYILAEDYGYGSVAAGYALMAPAAMYGALQMVVSDNVERNIRIFHLLELLGLLGSVTVQEHSNFTCARFILSSSLFYGANMSQNLTATFRIKWAVPGHPVLNAATSNAVFIICLCAGMVSGPIISRSLDEACMNQNTFSMFCMGCWFFEVACSELAFYAIEL